MRVMNAMLRLAYTAHRLDNVDPLEAAQIAIDELRDENKMLHNENAAMMRAFEKLYWVADNAGEVLDIVSDMLARR